MKSIIQKINVQNGIKHSVYLGLFLGAIFIVTSCEPETPKVVNEDELITTIITILSNSTDSIKLESKDFDGDGPQQPVITVSGTLKTNTVYSGTVSFLNELVNPAENISEQVFDEAVDHQLFYQAPESFGSFVYNDKDSNDKPLGLIFTFTTGSTVTSGNLIVTLRHGPNKSALGVSDGSIVNAGGATDAQVIYPIEIQAKNL